MMLALKSWILPVLASFALAGCITPPGGEEMRVSDLTMTEDGWRPYDLVGEYIAPLETGRVYGSLDHIVAAAALYGTEINSSVDAKAYMKTVTFTATGYEDDSIAGERVTLKLIRQDEGERINQFKREALCRRGALAGQWTESRCP